MWVSRRLIYGQAALLGISATTFFVLGMMVGNLTSSPDPAQGSGSNPSTYSADCRVSGQVLSQRGGREVPDVGSVVVLFPRRTKPEQRLSPSLIMPATFVALDNPTIEAIHDTGGAVVRADADGKFNVLVDQNREYRLLVVSKAQSTKGRQLTEPQGNVLESWFAPPEKLIRDNDYQWRDVSATGEDIKAGVIAFD